MPSNWPFLLQIVSKGAQVSGSLFFALAPLAWYGGFVHLPFSGL
jgi:hypothetical protein